MEDRNAFVFESKWKLAISSPVYEDQCDKIVKQKQIHIQIQIQTKRQKNTNTNTKWTLPARFTKIGVPEGRVEGKSRLCNFAIHGNKFRGRWEKSLEEKDSIKSFFFPRNVSSHYPLFSGTAARSCFLRHTLEHTQKHWTVRTSSLESQDRGFASSLGTLTFSMGAPSKDMLSYFEKTLSSFLPYEVRDFNLLDFLQSRTSKLIQHT